MGKTRSMILSQKGARFDGADSRKSVAIRVSRPRTRLRGWPVPVRHFAVTDVWVRRDGRWQIMARDADLAPQVWRWIGAVGGALGMAVVLGLVALVRRRRRRRRAALQNADRMSDVATALPAA